MAEESGLGTILIFDYCTHTSNYPWHLKSRKNKSESTIIIIIFCACKIQYSRKVNITDMFGEKF